MLDYVYGNRDTDARAHSRGVAQMWYTKLARDTRRQINSLIAMRAIEADRLNDAHVLAQIDEQILRLRATLASLD